MDCINSFDIRLEKDVFYPGEQLNGVVLIESIAPIKLRGIRVFLRGRARVQWKMLKSGESRTLKDDQYLLDEKALLWGRDRHQQQQQQQPAPVPTSTTAEEAAAQPPPEEADSTQILPRGSHEMAFSFALPASQLPCSLETKAGTIRYYVKVIVDVPYASSPQGIKYFTLIGPHTDCMEDKFLCPLNAQDHKVRCQGCCRRGVVALRAELERSAYCCGEQLRLRLQLENRQDCTAQLCVRLTQHLEYRIDRGGAPVDTKTVQSTALEWRSAPVPEHSQLRIEPAQEPGLRLPVLPPTMVGFCRLLQLYYVLRVSVDLQGGKGPIAPTAGPSSAECLEMDFPLTIGTVPQRPSHTQLYSVAYDFCAEHVETGKYISPEFRLGQVWDGQAEEGNEAIEDVILYRPVYVRVLDRDHHQQQGRANSIAQAPAAGRMPQHLPNGASRNEPLATSAATSFPSVNPA